MTDEGKINQLLSTLYAAPMEPYLWSTVVADIGSMTGVTKAALISHNLDGQYHQMLATVGDETKESIVKGGVKGDHWGGVKGSQ